MKSEVIEEEEKAEFPKLMKSKISEAVVLFTALKTGVVVHESGGDGDYGYASDKWNMSSFEDFNDKVILSNK